MAAPIKISDGKIIFNSKEKAERLIQKLGYDTVLKMNSGGKIYYEDSGNLIEIERPQGWYSFMWIFTNF